MGNIGTLPGERLAGLSADLFHKLQAGSLTLDELALFTQRKNPFALEQFERNEHGHIIVTITGLDLTGAQEIERLEAAKYRIGDYARQMLTSTKPDGYDAKHLLVAGQAYKIVLLPSKHITRDADRTTRNLCAEAEKFGYGKPLGGITPRIRETISDEQMEKMEFWYIVTLHDPISDAGGGPHVLSALRGDGRWLNSYWVSPAHQWDGFGAFAFVLPAS